MVSLLGVVDKDVENIFVSDCLKHKIIILWAKKQNPPPFPFRIRNFKRPIFFQIMIFYKLNVIIFFTIIFLASEKNIIREKEMYVIIFKKNKHFIID